MEFLIYLSITEYFIYYLFNYTLLFEKFKGYIEYNFNIFKVKGDWKYNLLYPLFCPLCFSFHFTWILLIINPNISLVSLSFCPIMVLTLDNLTRFLAKNGN